VISRSLPGQDDAGPATGPINRPSDEAPDPARGQIAAALLGFTVLVAVVITAVNLAGVHLPGQAVIAVASLLFGPGIPGAMLLKLPSLLVEFVLGVALSLSAVMLLTVAFVEMKSLPSTSILVLLNGATVLLAIPAARNLTRPQGVR
jgi:hypothetical protein